jgi:hypothetical protein
MSTPIALARAASDLNDIFSAAGRTESIRSADAWAEEARQYRSGSGFQAFLQDALQPITARPDAPAMSGAERVEMVEEAMRLAADIWDASADDGDERPTAHQILIATATAEQAAMHLGFLRAVADMCEAALIADEPALMRVPQDLGGAGPAPPADERPRRVCVGGGPPAAARRAGGSADGLHDGAGPRRAQRVAGARHRDLE